MIQPQKFGNIVFINPANGLFMVTQDGEILLQTDNPRAAVIYIAGLFESKIINHFKPLLAAEGYDEKGRGSMTTDEYKKIVSASVSEEAEQAHMMAWCAWAQNTYPQLDLAVHVPNEGKRSAAAGYKLKQAGMRAGFPDFFLPVPIIDTDGRLIYSGLAIELKRQADDPQKTDRMAGKAGRHKTRRSDMLGSGSGNRAYRCILPQGY